MKDQLGSLICKIHHYTDDERINIPLLDKFYESVGPLRVENISQQYCHIPERGAIEVDTVCLCRSKGFKVIVSQNVRMIAQLSMPNPNSNKNKGILVHQGNKGK